MFSRYQLVHDALGSQQNRAELSKRLMEAYPSTPTDSARSRIVQWCADLSGAASLKYLDADALRDEDYDILRARFSEKELRRIKKALDSE